MKCNGIPMSSQRIWEREEIMTNAPNSSAPILRVSNIESFYGPIMAIRGVSLEVPRGKIVTAPGATCLKMMHAFFRS